MSQQKIHTFFSRQEQEQPIRDCNCGKIMAVCEVSSSVPKNESIGSRENCMAVVKIIWQLRSNQDSTSVNEPSTRLSTCMCIFSCCESFVVAHHLTYLSQSKSSQAAVVYIETS